MHIRKLTLRNVGPHEDFQHKLKPGLVGVVGRNGAGKSTLVNALYGCFTNDWTRLNAIKEGAVRDTADEDDESFVELEVRHGDVDFTLTRWLRPNKHRLVITGEKKALTKATDIAAKLEETLGLNRQLIDNYVFVAQGEVDSFLSVTDSERAKVFQLLCNTTRAEEIWKLGGELTGELMEVAHLDLDDNRHTLRDDIVVREQRVQDNLLKIEGLRGQMLSDKSEAAAEQTIQNYSIGRVYREQLDTAERNIVKAASNKEQAKAKEGRAKDLLLQAKELEVAASKEAEGARTALAQVAQVSKQQKRREELESRLGKLVMPKFSRIAGMSTERQDQLREQISKHVGELNESHQILKTFEVEGVVTCPTCGTPVTQLDEHLQVMRSRLETHPRLLADWRSELKDQIAYATGLAAYEEAKRTYRERKNQMADELSAMSELDMPAGNPEDWQAAVVRAEVAEDTLENAASYHAECGRSSAGVTAHLTMLQANEAELKANLAKIKVSKADFAKAQKRLAEHTTAAKEVMGLELSNRSLLEIIEVANTELKRKDRLIARAAKARTLIERMVRIREVCHRDYWPRMVAQNYLEDIRDEMNTWLAQFGPPFRVRVQDGLNFEFREPGCPWRSAALLSGGQKVVMSLAFRKAVNLLFAAEVGMMALDEPSEALDEFNLSCLREALHDLSADSKRSGNQVIVITHHQILIPSFDQVIEVVA